MKDLNWRKMNMKLRVPPEDKARLLSALQRDSQFLASVNLLDYSLLVGIVENDEPLDPIADPDEAGKPPFRPVDPVSSLTQPAKSIYRMQSCDGKLTYLMGIIDTTTNFGFSKKMEAFVKGCLHGEQASCVRPQLYADRFFRFFSDQFA